MNEGIQCNLEVEDLFLKKKRYSKERIFKILLEIESGKTVAETCRKYSVSEAMVNHWRQKYRGMDKAELKRLKELEQGNWWVVSILIAAILILLILVTLGYLLNWGWVGVGENIQPQFEQEFQRSKTLWDWMDLLIIPLILTVGLYLLNKSARDNEFIIAQGNRQVDLYIALDRQRQNSLDEYYSEMMKLIVEHSLEAHMSNDKAGAVARGLTLSVLPTLDGSRKSKLLGFLCESKLLKNPTPPFHIGRADLSGLVWSKVHLTDINLGGVNLCRADLSDRVGLLKCNLSSSNLCCANLSGASLAGSILRESELRGAILNRANMTDTNLSLADLRGADLSEAFLNWADLEGADLRGAILKDAKLDIQYQKQEQRYKNVSLFNAKLGGADLGNAKLEGANVEMANLKGIKNWTIGQLRKASYGKMIGTVMPDGTQLQVRYQDNGEVSSQGPTFDQWAEDYIAKHSGTETDIRDVMDVARSVSKEECECEPPEDGKV